MPHGTNDVRPFVASHYNPDKVGEIGRCLSQPYDVIGERELESYLALHPNNVVRLTLGKAQPGDDERNNRYTRARSTFDDWVRSGVLSRTNRPSFWVYEQEFDLGTGGTRKVKGFIGAVRLHDYDEGIVLPHEQVMQNVVDDRLKLTEASRIQFEYIWSLYQDKAYVIDNILDECERDRPIIDYVEPGTGVRHRFWRLVDAAKCSAIQRTMRDLKLYIADGHHRYQTMLTLRNRMRELHPDAPADSPWEYIMMFLVNSKHEGLTILPTHRMLRNLRIDDPYAVVLSLMDHFHIRKYPFTAETEAEARRLWLRDLASRDAGDHKIGARIINNNSYYLATLKDAEAYEEMVDLDFSSEWKRLDVNILNTVILKNILRFTEEQLNKQENIGYTKDLDVALRRVEQRQEEVALILNGTRLEDVITIAENGEKMPRKSTHFYPKPLSGLVFYTMDQNTDKNTDVT
jgi:uncharacterized protein (DUF1015 family)